MKRNYMENIIMKYQEQFVNFLGKQGLAIKSKERIELFDIISCQLARGVNYILFGREGTIYTYKLLKLFPSKQPSVFFWCF